MTAPTPRAASLALAFALALGALLVPAAATADASSRDEAIEQALRASGDGARVLGVRELRENGRGVYAVKVLADGRVRVIRIPKR